MTEGQGQLDRVLAHIKATLGDPTQLTWPGGYPSSLALCIVDSVQSPTVPYGNVRAVVSRYRSYRKQQSGDADEDGTEELIETFTQLGGADAWAAAIGTRNLTSSHRGAPLKAEAILAAAASMQALGITTASALRGTAGDAERIATVGKAWRAVTGQSSGITWRYLLMLAGVQGVKPDRMICRFVADALGLQEREVSPELAEQLILGAAKALDMQASTLDHAIWRWQRDPK